MVRRRRLTWSLVAFAFALSLAACGGKSSPAAPSVSPVASTVVVSSEAVAADGTTAATVTVTVVDASGQPMSGQTVQLAYTGTGTVSPATATTDANGQATFTIVSDAGTSGTVAATVNPGPAAVVLAAEPALEFVSAWKAVATGKDHTLAVKADGSLWAWGNAPAPGVLVSGVPVQIGRDFETVAAGGYSRYALKKDGTLWAWGEDWCAGPPVDPTRDLPWADAPVQIGTGFASVSGGGDFAVALKPDGTVWAWGYNDTNNNAMPGVPQGVVCPPVQVASDAVAVAASANVVILKADGTVWTWGASAATPEPLGAGYVKVFAGAYELGALTADGTLRVWSEFDHFYRGTWSPVATATGIASAASGGHEIVAAGVDGTLWTWPRNWPWAFEEGQPLYGDRVARGTGFASVAAGYGHSAAVKSDGTLWTWGYNEACQLGDGTCGVLDGPTRIGTGFKHVASGVWSEHTVGVRTDGSLWLAGDNSRGQLGDGTTEWRQWPVQWGSGFASADTGMCSTVAVKADGTLWSWGCNSYGQLGDGTTVDRPFPLQIGTGYAAVAAGTVHVLALKTDGTLWAWGDSVGNGYSMTTLDDRVPNQIGSGFVSIAAQYAHSLAVKGDGTLWAWGGNDYGESGVDAGPPTYPPSGGIAVPEPTQIGTGFASVGAGPTHSVAIAADGSLWAWGDNAGGQLGLGDPYIAYVWTPTRVGDGFVAAQGGYQLTAALKSDGTLWGAGNYWEAWTPVQIGSGFTWVAPGAELALKGDELWAGWGGISGARLGNGSGDKPDPVQVP